MIDWKEIAKPNTDVMPQLRNCRNCEHRSGIAAWDYECTRAGGLSAWMCVQNGPCGPDLKMWAPRRPWWRRFTPL